MSDSDDGGIPGIVDPAARYEELLRPCRDLAANWNVDIVAKLSDYLAELNIDINSLVEADFREAQVNFQHAALVIEGGTCVYSRKVDYLYGLVFAAADMIYEARGRSFTSKKSKDGSSVEEDDADGTPVSDGIDFLLLDDQLQAGQPDRERITLPLRDLTDNSELLRLRDLNRLVSVPLHLLPPGPQNARRASTANANNTGLRMTDATINEATGALILDGIGVETVDRSLSPFGRNDFDVLAGAAVVDPDVIENREPPVLGLVGDDDYDGDLPGSDEECLEDAIGPLADELPTEYGDSSSVLQKDEKITSTANCGKSVPPPDPYEPLDPHDSSGTVSRPAQRGKTWTKPRQKPWAKMATENRSNEDEHEPANVGDMTCLELFSRVFETETCTLFRKTNRFVSFDAAAEPFRCRMRSISTAKRRRTRLISAHESDIDNLDTISGDNKKSEFGGSLDESDLFDNPVESDDFDAPDDDSVGGELPDFSELENIGDGDQIGNGADGIGLGIDDSVEQQVEKIAASYEDACRKYLLESSILWQEHAVDSQLEQRVADWRSKIEPLLAEEEERHAFDIKEYGAAILDRFSAKQEESDSLESDMATVFGTSEPFEVCRNFLAALQLINSYKIEVVSTSTSSRDGENQFNPTIALVRGGRSIRKSGTATRRVISGDDVPARTPSKSRLRPPLVERPQALSGMAEFVSSPSVKTPRRRLPGKRNRQAGSTPVSARRAPSKARTSVVGSPIR